MDVNELIHESQLDSSIIQVIEINENDIISCQEETETNELSPNLSKIRVIEINGDVNLSDSAISVLYDTKTNKKVEQPQHVFTIYDVKINEDVHYLQPALLRSHTIKKSEEVRQSQLDTSLSGGMKINDIHNYSVASLSDKIASNSIQNENICKKSSVLKKLLISDSIGNEDTCHSSNTTNTNSIVTSSMSCSTASGCKSLNDTTFKDSSIVNRSAEFIESNKKRLRRCLYCGVINPETSLFRFPSDLKLRTLWAQFCHASVDEICPSSRLCANHFSSKDISGPISKVNGRMNLKKNAIPSHEATGPELKKFNIEGDVYSSTNNISSRSNPVTFSQINNIKTNSINSTTSNVPTFTKSEFIDMDESLEKDSVNNIFSNKIYTLINNGLIFESKENIRDSMNEMETSDVSPQLNKSMDEIPTTSQCNEISTRKRKSVFPRYVSEIELSDLETSEKAEICLSLVKRVTTDQRKKIHSLQNQNRRLRIRIQNLEENLSRFYESNYISEIEEYVVQ